MLKIFIEKNNKWLNNSKKEKWTSINKNCAFNSFMDIVNAFPNIHNVMIWTGNEKPNKLIGIM